MSDPLEKFSQRLSALIPGDIKHMQKDFESNVRNLLQSTLNKMNLVSREEFDVQSAVLQRTREKLEQLEKQIEQLAKKDIKSKAKKAKVKTKAKAKTKDQQ